MLQAKKVSLKKNTKKSPTIEDVFEVVTDIKEAIGVFSNNVEDRFERLESKVDGIDTRLTKVESQMVTKEYLDDKLADLRGDLVIMVRKEDTKLKKLVDILEQRQVISINEREAIFALEPFAQN